MLLFISDEMSFTANLGASFRPAKISELLLLTKWKNIQRAFTISPTRFEKSTVILRSSMLIDTEM